VRYYKNTNLLPLVPYVKGNECVHQSSSTWHLYSRSEYLTLLVVNNFMNMPSNVKYNEHRSALLSWQHSRPQSSTDMPYTWTGPDHTGPDRASRAGSKVVTVPDTKFKTCERIQISPVYSYSYGAFQRWSKGGSASETDAPKMLAGSPKFLKREGIPMFMPIKVGLLK